MKAGVGIDGRLGLTREQQRRLVQESAMLGFESLWTPAGLTGRSIFQTCREWWEASHEIVSGGLTVGTSVLPVPGWSVPPLAAEAATVSEVTGGKFVLGIGLGSYPAQALRDSLGLPLVPPLALARDYLQPLHALLHGERVSFVGKTVTVRGIRIDVNGPPTPVYLAAMGPKMLALAGELADGVLPNWSSPEEISRMRPQTVEGARRAARDPSSVPFAQYIRVCIDEDVEAARRTFATQVLGYALARAGQPKNFGYRGHFARMGFDEVLTALEARRDAGEPMTALVQDVPTDLLATVGYFGRADGVREALHRLAQGLDEAMVRILTVREGDLDACVRTVRALEPSGWAR
ncbi:MAG: hypothetical protein NVSMB2_12310 [Chloroflexota bacterium]